MALKFASKEWVEQLKKELNNSEVYKDAAKDWEGDLSFVIHYDNHQSTSVYLDLWHGECRNAYISEEPTNSVFTISGPFKTWQKMVEGKSDPMTTLLTGRLKLKGPMARIMKSPRAAGEVVNCAMGIETDWNILENEKSGSIA